MLQNIAIIVLFVLVTVQSYVIWKLTLEVENTFELIDKIIHTDKE
jgi:hypothetical protein